MGIIINRPTDVSLKEILNHLGVEDESMQVSADALNSTPVYVGGPIQRERGFILHEPNGEWDSSVEISDEVAITSSKDILIAIANNSGPEKKFVALGYCAWGPGQLEEEISENLWLSGPMDIKLLFEVSDDDRWHAAAATIGVDINLLSSDMGHA